MELIKENKEKHRLVYFNNDRYRKVWTIDRSDWIYQHVKKLRYVMPDFVLDYGVDYIEYKIIEGITANNFEHTGEFIQKIYKFCLNNIQSTKPWVHGDWVLSNIIIQPNGNMVMIDWDNLGIYREEEYMKKLHNDLISAFGEDKFKRAINDSTSI
jgi:RIO-like serine/threonine protein kinase